MGWLFIICLVILVAAGVPKIFIIISIVWVALYALFWGGIAGMIFSPEMRETLLPFYLIGFGLFFVWGLLGSLYDWFKERKEKTKKEVAGPNSVSDAKTTVDDKPSNVISQEGNDAFRTCPKCGKSNNPDLYCCWSCHFPLKPIHDSIGSSSKRCTACGASNHSSLEVCGICEKPLDVKSKEDALAPKSAKPKKYNWWVVVIIIIAIIILRPVIRDFMTGFMSGFKGATAKVSSPATENGPFLLLQEFQPSGLLRFSIVNNYPTREACGNGARIPWKSRITAECIPNKGQYDSFFRHEPTQDWYMTFKIGESSEGLGIFKISKDAMKDAFKAVDVCVREFSAVAENMNPPTSFTAHVISPQGEVDVATGELKQSQNSVKEANPSPLVSSQTNIPQGDGIYYMHMREKINRGNDSLISENIIRTRNKAECIQKIKGLAAKLPAEEAPLFSECLEEEKDSLGKKVSDGKPIGEWYIQHQGEKSGLQVFIVTFPLNSFYYQSDENKISVLKGAADSQIEYWAKTGDRGKSRFFSPKKEIKVS